MKDMLSDMGMPIAFNQDKATFKLFDQPLSTWIDEIYHQAVVIVDEKGTEAAAATGIVVSTESASAPPPVFKASSPVSFYD